MNQYQTTGIILRRAEYGEADRIITMLTSDFGKIHLMAKGVRKQKSKLAGGIELFSISEIHFIKGRSDLDTLVSTRLIRHYGEIVKDLVRTDTAYNMLKIVDKTIEDRTGTDYYKVLDESLAAINDFNFPISLVELSFRVRVLHLLGQIPDFSRASNGNKLDPSKHYSFDFETVAFREDNEGPFNVNHLKVLKLASLNKPQNLKNIVDIGNISESLLPLVRTIAAQYSQVF